MDPDHRETHICAETEIVVDNALFSPLTLTLTRLCHLLEHIHLIQYERSINHVRPTARADSAFASKTLVRLHFAIDLRAVYDTGTKDISVSSIGFQELHIAL
jgi:hypothetical protein